jgi:hypothetical protein
LGFPQPGPEAALFPPPAAISSENAQGQGIYGPVYLPPPPACGASLPATLDAGALTLSGSGLGAVALAPSTQSGRLTYQASLPPGTLEGGTYQLTGQGGIQVGAFTANADVPPPISAITTITADAGLSSLQPGTQFEAPCVVTGFYSYCHGWYSFYWTGGDDRSVVTIQFIVGGSFQALQSAPAGDGDLAFQSSYVASPGTGGFPFFDAACMLMPSGNVEVIVTQTPSQTPSQPFNAPGLGLGGEVTWKYVWDFRGLAN